MKIDFFFFFKLFRLWCIKGYLYYEFYVLSGNILQKYKGMLKSILPGQGGIPIFIWSFGSNMVSGSGQKLFNTTCSRI